MSRAKTAKNLANNLVWLDSPLRGGRLVFRLSACIRLMIDHILVGFIKKVF
jgi:hypothetical protein